MLEAEDVACGVEGSKDGSTNSKGEGVRSVATSALLEISIRG